MKKFIEEYGFGILTAIVIIMLICLATPVGTVIRDSVKGVINDLSERTQSVMNVAGDATEQLANTLKENSDTNTETFTVQINSVSYGGLALTLENVEEGMTWSEYLTKNPNSNLHLFEDDDMIDQGHGYKKIYIEYNNSGNFIEQLWSTNLLVDSETTSDFKTCVYGDDVIIKDKIYYVSYFYG